MTNEPITPFEDTPELRREVLATCFLMRDRLGYFVGTWGNMSARLAEGLLVTPSRVNYEECGPEGLVVVSWDGVKLRGERVPTSETELHRQIMLERPDLGVLIHHHAPWSSVFACARQGIPVLSDDMAEVIGGAVNCAPYVPAGRHKELAVAARAAIGPDACAVLMGNHGVICGGRSLYEAVVCCQFVEKAAQIYLQARAIGGVVPIPEDLWREERHRYLYKYGRAEDLAEVLREEQ